MTPRKLLYVSARACPDELAAQLQERGWELVQVPQLRAALAQLRNHAFLIALLDVELPHPRLATEFEACREVADACEWVAVLPRGALQQAWLRDMVLQHFFDHHTHPASPAFLCQSLGHALGRALLRTGSTAVEGDLGLVGQSPAMRQLRRLVQRTGAAEAPAVIEGEAGSGKETVARALHACSPKAQGPFVVLNCATLSGEPASLLDAASGGTLLLDHVAELPREWQARLLRRMTENATLRTKLGRSFNGDIRVLATTESPLADAVAQGFRQDLFYRLNVVPIVVPPLRSRKEDVIPLARHFHAQCLRSTASHARGFSRRAMAALAAHDWPGNVSELFGRVQRAVLLAERRAIGPEELGLQAPPEQRYESLEAIRVRAERDAIALSLDRASHNVSVAARELGVSRMTLYRLMAKHAIGPAKDA
jgi:two-component system, NtrC family, response regulator HydG